jgi:tetratricopeptide (TPR) repeat protein
MAAPADTEPIAPLPPGATREERLDELLAGYLRAAREGRAPDRARLLAGHPDLAAELAEFFADQDRFAHLAAPLRAAVGPPAGPWGLGEGQGTLPEQIGGHRILGEIARGGMGVVLRARHAELGRLVALKVLLAGPYASADDVQRFRREAEAAAHLDHPHIVPIYEVGQHDGLPYFTMKLLRTSLAQRLRSGALGGPGATTTALGDESCPPGPPAPAPAAARPCDPKAAARLAAAVARAVHHAHQRGVLHRDLKPANILLDEHDQPHVSDFGLARRAGAPGLTETGALVGTPAYMAPEQAQAGGEVTVATDVYGLGAVLYECLTGQPPFKAASAVETLRLVLDRDPVRPRALRPGVPRDLETVCLKCLHKEPGKRYAGALELARDLERFLRGEAIVARPVGAAGRAVRWARRQPVVAGLAAALVAAVVAGFVLVLHQWGRAREAFARAEAQRDEAEAALARARAARAEADRAAHAADASFHQAHAAVNDFCLSLSEELARVPGLQPVRHRLLQSARRYYQGFVQERSADPTLRRELADTHARLARITAAVGERRQALAEYREALALYQELHRAAPADLEVRRKLVSTLLNIANFHNVRDALGASAEAQALCEEFLRERPDDLALESCLALLLANRGSCQISAGRFDEARASLEEAMSRQEDLLRRHPRNAAVIGELTNSLHNYGVLLERQRDHAGSLCCFLKAHALRQLLVRNFPTDPALKANLADLRHHGGLCLRDVGQPKAARAAFDSALAMRLALAADNPHVTRHQCDLAASLTHRAGLLHREGKKESALTYYAQARTILERVVQLDPAAPGLRKMLAETLFSASTTYGAMKKKGEEADALAQARRLQEGLVKAEPENVEHRFNLARTLNNLGINLWARKQAAAAREVLWQAVGLSRDLVARRPDAPGYRRLLNAHYGVLAEVAWRQGDAAESVRVVRLRQALWGDEPAEHYRAACELARAAALLGKGPEAPTGQRLAEQEKYVGLALAALRRAVRAGFRDARRLRGEPDLGLLRPRAEFRALLAGLAAAGE